MGLLDQIIMDFLWHRIEVKSISKWCFNLHLSSLLFLLSIFWIKNPSLTFWCLLWYLIRKCVCALIILLVGKPQWYCNWLGTIPHEVAVISLNLPFPLSLGLKLTHQYIHIHILHFIKYVVAMCFGKLWTCLVSVIWE